MSLTFRRTVEDFMCDHCRAEVQGTGFTNHCPHCLWSKHVDIHPGDRAESCGGMMEPVGVELDHGEYRIRHRCEQCGIERLNKAQDGDSQEAIRKRSGSG